MGEVLRERSGQMIKNITSDSGWITAELQNGYEALVAQEADSVETDPTITHWDQD